MQNFAGLVLRASQAMGAPLYLANHLGVEPSEVYRWISGIERPQPGHQQHFEQRLLRVLQECAAIPAARRRAAARG